MTDSPGGARPPWRYRVKWLGVPLALAAFSGWFASLLIWPVWAGIGTMVGLFGLLIYLALFVWPIERYQR